MTMLEAARSAQASRIILVVDFDPADVLAGELGQRRRAETPTITAAAIMADNIQSHLDWDSSGIVRWWTAAMDASHD